MQKYDVFFIFFVDKLQKMLPRLQKNFIVSYFFYDGKYWFLCGLVFDVWKGNKSGNYCL